MPVVLSRPSNLGAAIYRHYELDPVDYDTFILLQDGKALIASDAVIALFRQLGGLFSIAVVLKIIPRPALDWAYGVIARNRMRFFGRRDACFLPDASSRDRFLAG